MNLACMSKTKISFMIIFYFLGTILNGLFAHLPDSKGRKKSVIIGMAISVFAQTLIIFVNDYVYRSIGFFLLGMSQIKVS